MNILFLGQKPVGQRAFARLLAEDSLRPVAAVSNTSLKNWWRDNAIHRQSQAAGIPFIDNARRNNDLILKAIRDYRVDCLLSVQHGWILPEEVIDAVGGRAFNLHLAPLPDYKGWHGVNYTLLRRQSVYGYSLHMLAAEVDSGDMVYAGRVPVRPDDTALSLYRRTEDAAMEGFERLIGDLRANREPPRVPLKGAGEFFAPSDLDAFREITPDLPADEIETRVRALFFPPFEPAFMRIDGRKLFLLPEQGAVLWTPNAGKEDEADQ
ncbi:MAG: formyltransferase family protein [Alphaproteobacteria bacterium]